MHPIVQQVMLEHQVNLSGQEFEAALKLVWSQFPWGGDVKNFSRCLKYLSQARVCLLKYSEIGTYSGEFVSLVGSLGAFFSRNGEYDLAIEQYERTLRIYEKAFGVDHINTAGTIMNLGLLLKTQDQVETAEQQFSRGYHIFQTNLGPLHPNSLKAKSILESHWEECGQVEMPTNKRNWKSALNKVFKKSS
jgi:tetratricopeptide (TPR) repeat protein